jgi:hypothetical protein
VIADVGEVHGRDAWPSWSFEGLGAQKRYESPGSPAKPRQMQIALIEGPQKLPSRALDNSSWSVKGTPQDTGQAGHWERLTQKSMAIFRFVIGIY